MVSADGWSSLYAIRLTSGWLPITVWTAIAVGLVALMGVQLLRGGSGRVLRQLLIALVCGLVGGAVTWFVSDGIVLFGVELGWSVIIAAAVGFFLCGACIAAAVMTHGWRRVLAIVMVPMALIGTALRIDAIYGEFQTVGSLVDYDSHARISSVTISRDTVSVEEWNKRVQDGLEHPAREGRLLTATIPNTRSGFKARDAVVWLPPAALSDRPAQLPVMVMLAGQPGSPTRYFDASSTVEILTAYANEHHGLAPIVVSPDQNTGATTNSLCADTTKVGKAETYLTEDVPDWIRNTLPVSDQADEWTIGGFSQGGTCSTQLAPNHPDIYGNVLAVDGELAPTAGSKESMVEEYFGGDADAYERQVPVNAIAAHAPSDQVMILGAGEQDHESLANIRTIGEAARKAGWTVFEVKASDTGHDWRAVNKTLAVALPWLCDRMGLGSAQATFEHYVQDNHEGIEVLQ